LYQCFKRQLKTPTCFRFFFDPSSGSVERAWLKLLVILLCA